MDRRSPKRRVVVCGASIAGLYTAWRLAEAGHDVTLVERNAKRPPRRTLIVTPRLRDLLGAGVDAAVLAPVRRFDLRAGDARVTIPLARPDLIIERTLVMDLLRVRAEAAGAALHFGTRLEGVEWTGGNAVVAARAGDLVTRLPADVVVGAGGARSPVARAAGWAPQPTLPLLQAIVAMPEDCEPDTSRVWFEPDDTPYFYWLVPEGNGRAGIGVIGEDGPVTRRRLDAFLARHGMEPLEYQGARIPRYDRWTPVHRRVGGAEVYLVGDAAGQVKVSTVGGVVNGLWGAQGVVEHLTTGSSRTLRRLRRELDAHLLVRRAIHRFGPAEYARLFEAVAGSRALADLGRINRDETVRILLRLAVTAPGLCLLGLRGMLGTRSLEPRASEGKRLAPSHARS